MPLGFFIQNLTRSSLKFVALIARWGIAFLLLFDTRRFSCESRRAFVTDGLNNFLRARALEHVTQRGEYVGTVAGYTSAVLESFKAYVFETPADSESPRMPPQATNTEN